MKPDDYQRVCARSMQINRQINSLFASARPTKPEAPALPSSPQRGEAPREG